MKTVASLTELRRLAARAGASVQIGGRTINAQGARMAVVKGENAAQRAPSPTPASAPAPAPVPPATATDPALLEAVARMGETLADALLEAQQRPVQVVLPSNQPAMAPTPVRQPWVFTPEYDRNDLLVHVRAVSGARAISFRIERGDRQLVRGISATWE